MRANGAICTLPTARLRAAFERFDQADTSPDGMSFDERAIYTLLQEIKRAIHDAPSRCTSMPSARGL